LKEARSVPAIPEERAQARAEHPEEREHSQDHDVAEVQRALERHDLARGQGEHPKGHEPDAKQHAAHGSHGEATGPR
jgi:hypothetical protein